MLFCFLSSYSAFSEWFGWVCREGMRYEKSVRRGEKGEWMVVWKCKLLLQKRGKYMKCGFPYLPSGLEVKCTNHCTTEVLRWGKMTSNFQENKMFWKEVQRIRIRKGWSGNGERMKKENGAITHQLNTFFIPSNTFPTSLILDFTSVYIPPSTVNFDPKYLNPPTFSSSSPFNATFMLLLLLFISLHYFYFHELKFSLHKSSTSWLTLSSESSANSSWFFYSLTSNTWSPPLLLLKLFCSSQITLSLPSMMPFISILPYTWPTTLSRLIPIKLVHSYLLPLYKVLA